LERGIGVIGQGQQQPQQSDDGDDDSDISDEDQVYFSTYFKKKFPNSI
jgi:hypothetical protein